MDIFTNNSMSYIGPSPARDLYIGPTPVRDPNLLFFTHRQR